MKKAKFMVTISLIMVSLFAISSCAHNIKEKMSNEKEQTKSLTRVVSTQIVSGVKVGDILKFGSCEQDNNTKNGMEPIKWIVLAIEDSKIHLISENILDCKAYNESYNDVTWETCTLRRWLNEDFYNNSFSAAEKTEIAITKVLNDDNNTSKTPGGNRTNDMIFLIGYNEVKKYFLNMEYRLAAATNYAKSKGIIVSDKGNSLGNSSWWLRSPGYNSFAAWTISSDGSYLRGCSYNVNSKIIGVRPALWVFQQQ